MGKGVLLVTLAMSGVLRVSPALRVSTLSGQETDPLPSSPPSCSLKEIRRTHLHLEDGRSVYVEPQALAESQGAILLAGFPSYLGSPSGSSILTGEWKDTLVGVLVDTEGQVSPVPLPPEMKGREALGIRAVALEGRRWAILLPLLPQGDSFPEEQVPEEIWLGIFRPPAWERLERVPLPSDVRTYPFESSPLRGRGDSLAWVLPFLGADGVQLLWFLKRRGGIWTGEVLPVRAVNGVDLAPDPAGSWLVGVTHLDPEKESEAVSILTPSPSGWRSRILSTPDGKYLSRPRFSSDGRALAWQAKSGPFAFQSAEMRALNLEQPPLLPYTVLDGPHGGFVSVRLPLPFPSWISAQPFASTPLSHLRMVGLNGMEPIQTDSVPNPLGEVLQGIGLNDGHVLLTGPDRPLVMGGGELVSLILEFEVHCSSPPSPHLIQGGPQCPSQNGSSCSP